MKIRKVLVMIVIMTIIIGITSINSLAVTFDLDVSYDEKNVNLSSEDVTLDILNLLPGETDTSYININNKGNEKAKVYMNIKVADDQDLLKILQIVIKDSNDRELYKGEYDKLEEVQIEIDKGVTEKVIVETTLPETAGNEFQNKQINIKFDFKAEVEDKVEVEVEEEEEIIEQPKTNQSRIIIYSILLVIVIILIIILIILSINKKRKEKDKS